MEIYLDNAATTKPLLKDIAARHETAAWHNPSAAYKPAEAAFGAVADVRRQLTAELGLTDGVCVFTSGGTEANNTVVSSCFRKGAHYVASAIEHPSVYACFKHLEQLGANVDFVQPRGFGICPEDVAALVREDTALVSVMHVNNETGALMDVKAVCEAVKNKNPKTRVHADGVQALRKLPVNLDTLGVDYYTVSAHKIHALKGTGALLARRGAPIKPLLLGGEQENGLRAGTENTLGIQAFGAALSRPKTGAAHIQKLSDALVAGLSRIPDAVLNLPAVRVPHIVSVSFAGVRAEVLARALGERGICIGTGAACSRGKVSRVLLACGVPRRLAEGTVRISLCETNTMEEIEACLEALAGVVRQLRRLHG